jgi:hypothetical protein
MRERIVSAQFSYFGEAAEDAQQSIDIQDSRHLRSFRAPFSHFSRDESTSGHQCSDLVDKSQFVRQTTPTSSQYLRVSMMFIRDGTGARFDSTQNYIKHRLFHQRVSQSRTITTSRTQYNQYIYTSLHSTQTTAVLHFLLSKCRCTLINFYFDMHRRSSCMAHPLIVRTMTIQAIKSPTRPIVTVYMNMASRP